MPYSTDTRSLQPGDTFVAIRGVRYDGHDFAREALSKGAVAVIVERPIPDLPADRVVCVNDSEQHLAEVARDRINAANCQVIAITGSVGKTTTKNAIATVLASAFPVVASIGNLNTRLGLALTLANSELKPGSKLVLEMGATKKGDLEEICAWFMPEISVVTNVRGVHLETFGSLQGVQEAKSELVRALSDDGVACLNGDDRLTRAMQESCRGRTVLFGKSPESQITPELISAHVPLLGDYAIYTALAAFAVGREAGMDDAAINEAIGLLKAEKGRLRRLKAINGAELIDDSYNASPDATQAALRVLGSMTCKRRVTFLGDMLELGPFELKAHITVILEALDVANLVFLTGGLMRAAVDSLEPALQARVRVFDNSLILSRLLEKGEIYEPQPGDSILVKGSQGVRMERISKALLAKDISPDEVLARQSASWLAL